MSDLTATEAEPVTALDLSIHNGNEVSPITRDSAHYWSYSTLEQLPGSSTAVNINTTGAELGQLFSEQPDLPGAILFDDNDFAGVISQAHYYKCVSRAFGREIYHLRPCVIMLEGITVESLVLPSDCSIQTAVERCLTRPVDFIYEPFLVHHRDTGQYRLCALQVLLLASSQLAALRNRQMEQILNSVTDGLLVIDKNFRIGGEYSKVVGNIFERSDLRDVPLPDVLQPLLDAVTYEQLRDYLNILFDPKLIDRLIKSINPAKQISARFPSLEAQSENRIKHFAINFERIRTQAEISQVLVRIEDITQRMNLALELQQQEAAAEEKLQLVMQILQVEPDLLNRFLTHFDEALSVMAGMIDQTDDSQPPQEAVHSLFRRVHTLKGEAALLRLTSHERALHRIEDHLGELRSDPQLEAGNLASITPFREKLQKLGDQTGESLEQLKQLGSVDKLRAPASSTPNTAREAGFVFMLSSLISDLSERVGKPATFYTSVSDHDWPGEHKEVLHEVLIHLARNSMVHGIEPAEVRVARGKNPAGLIQLELKTHPEFYEIIFQDDGNGLDYDKIRNRAGKLGWNAATEEELRQAIFEPGFSTMDKVTDLAGRGVGLDVIRNSLQKVGGQIVPHSVQGTYCAFQILLPKTSIPLIA